MRKMTEGRIEQSKCNGRVLARMLAEDLRKTHGGSGSGTITANTVTDLGDQYDLTFRGSDASF